MADMKFIMLVIFTVAYHIGESHYNLLHFLHKTFEIDVKMLRNGLYELKISAISC